MISPRATFIRIALSFIRPSSRAPINPSRTARVEAELAVAKAKASDDQALITHQQLQIAKLTRELYGQRSERRVQLLDQMALAFEELESSASEDEIAAARGRR
jgi:transposase IS166 family protein